MLSDLLAKRSTAVLQTIFNFLSLRLPLSCYQLQVWSEEHSNTKNIWDVGVACYLEMSGKLCLTGFSWRKYLFLI